MSGFKQTRQDYLRLGVLSTYLSHNYAKGNFKNSYTKTSGISCNKLHGPDTLKRNIFQRQSSQLSADLSTSFPGFSPTRLSLSLRRAGRREPWKRGCGSQSSGAFPSSSTIQFFPSKSSLVFRHAGVLLG